MQTPRISGSDLPLAVPEPAPPTTQAPHSPQPFTSCPHVLPCRPG